MICYRYTAVAIKRPESVPRNQAWPDDVNDDA
ncbi:hypothetical protein LTSEURB_1831, partial [Salmonella enterica subsp. enterica serovar Urbana str. R8-2977]